MHAIKECGGVGVWLHPFLILALDEVSGQSHIQSSRLRTGPPVTTEYEDCLIPGPSLAFWIRETTHFPTGN